MVHGARGRWWASALVVVVLFSTSCTQAPAPVPPSYVPSAEMAYLPSPLSGYPLSVDGGRLDDVRLAHAGLERMPEKALALATEMLDEDAAFHPASVLFAQAQFLRGEDRVVLEELAPVVEDVPSYVAAQLVRGRAAERLGEDLTAVRAFRAIADHSNLAERRAEELLPRGVEKLLDELLVDLERGQLEAAQPRLTELVEWVGEEDPRVLEIELRRAVLAADEEQELSLIRRLLAAQGEAGEAASEPSLEPVLKPGSRTWELLLRQAALELEAGEVRQGLDLFERLAAVDAEDAQVREGLGRAVFLRRLQLLPVRVQELGRNPELDRADLATILYWLVPSVRYARVDNPPIANDILDHPQRDEIVRVVGLGLMRVDRTLHQFEPTRSVTRRATLLALLRVLAMAEKPVACLAEGEAESLGRSSDSICQAAARCRLIPERADCLPSASVSGAEARELFRRGLELLGSE